MTDLYQACNQWSQRPSDERFATMTELLDATVTHRERAINGTGHFSDLRAVPHDGGVLLSGGNGHKALLTHWAFGQLCARAGAPASYLRTLPPELASTNLNHGLAAKVQQQGDTEFALLLHQPPGGQLIARALLTKHYTRIWNYELVRRLIELPTGWRVPPARPAFAGQSGARPATAEDVMDIGRHGQSVAIGDMIAPAGLYASAEDMFVFMVNEQARINDGSEFGLSRGFFLSNSEVGKQALRLTTFLYAHVCGNHIVWGARHIRGLSIRHVGAADERFKNEVQAELRAYSEDSSKEDEYRIVATKRFSLGRDKDQVIDMIFQRGILSRVRATEAYETAEEHDDDPRTAWGFVQGVTRMSQKMPNADARTEIDRAASKILEMAF